MNIDKEVLSRDAEGPLLLDPSTLFRNVEEQELRDPSIPDTIGGGLVYPSRNLLGHLSGTPVLTDFGQMRLVEPANNDWWMPDLYRAPEVLLGLPWGFPVDVWSIGVMVSEDWNLPSDLLTIVFRHSSCWRGRTSLIP